MLARGHRALGEWAAAEPALTGYTHVYEVAAAAGRRGAHDDVLTALLVRAREGDRLAGRTMLQAMLGNLVRLAVRTRAHAAGDLEESQARALAVFWEVISDYPLHRRSCHPVDGISLDVLRTLTRGHLVTQTHPAGLQAELPADEPAPSHMEGEHSARAAFWASAELGAVGECGDEQLIVILAWVIRTAALTADDARVLLALHSPERPGEPLTRWHRPV